MKKSTLTVRLENLTALTKDFIIFHEEKQCLDSAEREAQKELDDVAALGRFDADRQRGTVDNASGTLSVIAGRRKHIAKALKPLLEQMRTALRQADGAWQAVIEANRAVLEERYYKAIAEFYPESSRNDVPQPETLPAWHNINKAVWNGSPLYLTEANALSQIAEFNSLIEANIARFDLSLPENL